MPESIANQKERVYAGLAYAAFEALITGKNQDALNLLGNVTKRLLVDANVDIPPTETVLHRLMSEALIYIQENPTAEW